MDIAKGKNRIDSVDILRAVGIILMIMGHVGFGGVFDRYIHSFNMPVFFLISGSLFVSKDNISIGKQIIKKAERLLLPYLFYAVINYIFWLVLVYEPGKSPYAPLVRLVTYNTEKLPICGALWFLTAMFFAEVYYIIIDRLIRIKWLRTVVVLVLAIGASFLQGNTKFRLPLTIDTAVICMGFLEIGRVLKSVDQKAFMKKFASKKVLLVLIGFVLLVTNGVLSFVNEYVNVKSGMYGFVPFFWINAIIGSGAYLTFAVWLDKVVSDRNVIRTVLVHIGRHSMIFLGLNQLIILLISAGYGALKLPSGIYKRGIVIFAVSLTCLYIISFVCSRVNKKLFRKLLGI